MPKLNNLDKTLKGINKIANHASAISVVVGLVSTAVTFFVEIADKREQKFNVSTCNTIEHPMTIEELKEYLEKAEVKAVYIPMKVSEADPKYRDCFELQVVDVTPSGRITRGDIVQVHYITSEVINKSRCLYEDSEQQRTTAELEKQRKQSEQKMRTRHMVTERIDVLKQEIKKIPTAFYKNGKKASNEQEHNDINRDA